MHPRKRQSEPTLQRGEALSVSFRQRTLVDSIAEAALDVEAARRISGEQSLLDLQQQALELRHYFLLAGLQLGDRTAVFRGPPFPFALAVLEKRSQTMMFGYRRRELRAQLGGGCFLAGLQVADGAAVFRADAGTVAFVLLRARRQSTGVFSRTLGQLGAQCGQHRAVPGLHVSEGRVVFGSQTIQFQLLLVGARGQTALVGERLRQLRTQLGQRLALAGLHVGEGPLVLCDQTFEGTRMVGAYQTQLALGHLDPLRQKALLGRRSRQLRV